MKFRRACRHIAAAAPLVLRPAPIEVITLLSHRDIMLYLVAIRTLYRQLPGGNITVIDDGTLTAEDRKLLARHVPAITLVPVSAIDASPCPRGSCWERLVHVIDRAADAYVIQMDSDTLTLGSVPEIARCISLNQSFVLGTDNGQQFLSLEESSAVAERIDSQHVQIQAERVLRLLPPNQHTFYVRGCAGFAGFARGTSSRPALIDFSERMQNLLNGRWSEWGSEQVGSNFLVANAPNSKVLPYPKYSCFEGIPDSDAVFLHFYGTYRFKNSVYQRLAEQQVSTFRPC